MNIDIIGRIRPAIQNEGPVNLDIGTDYRITSRPGGPSFSFLYLHGQKATNQDVFSKHVEHLVDLFVAGYNSSLLVFGESESGKSYTIAGDSTHKSGIVPLTIAAIFSKIEPGDKYLFNNNSKKNQNFTSTNDVRLSLRMVEIYNEQIRDLMVIPHTHDYELKLQNNPDTGVFVGSTTAAAISKASEATTKFREAWQRRNEVMTDYGAADKNCTIFIQFELHSSLGTSTGLPNRSRLTFVKLPGAEKLLFESDNLRLREGPTLNNAILALAKCASDLAKKQDAARVVNYNESVLTQLLQDELGGNCRTRMLTCLRPQSDPDSLGAILRTCNVFSKVRNFPLLNDYYAQLFLTQQRARLYQLQSDLGLEINSNNAGRHIDIKEELRRLQTENIRFRDKNEQLLYRLQQLQDNFGIISHVKKDLNGELLSSEEEKLKVSKALVEMEIENTRLKEDVEAIKFELSNKILKLENDLLETQIQRDNYVKENKRFQELEAKYKSLADDYVAMKEQSQFNESEVKRLLLKNEELSMELLNLVNAKETLRHQLQTVDLAKIGRTKVYEHDHDVERIKAIVAANKISSIPARQSKSTKQPEVEGSQEIFDREMKNIRNQYTVDQKRLQSRLNDLMKEINNLKNLNQEKLRKNSTLNAQLIATRSDRDYLQSQVNRLQHKTKDIYEEYRSRLVKYVQDISEYVGQMKRGTSDIKIRDYVTKMLADLKDAHRTREEQLSLAAQAFRSQMMDVSRRHEVLLVAYGNLRQYVEDQGIIDVNEFAPDITKLALPSSELLSDTQADILRLQRDLQVARNDVETERRNNSVHGNKAQSENMDLLRRQLREFTHNTQNELEEERAKLLAENQTVKEQLRVAQDYIDKQLPKYRNEIVQLRNKGINKNSNAALSAKHVQKSNLLSYP